MRMTHTGDVQDEHGYYVQDLGSSSSTFVNGNRLSEAKVLSPKTHLMPNDVVRV